MNTKKRQLLKTKRKFPIVTSSCTNNTSNTHGQPGEANLFITISEESKKLLYSAVYQMDPTFLSIRFPPSQNIATAKMTEPAAAVQSIVSNSFFPPSNLKLLTRKPLLPLDIIVSESTTDDTEAKTTVGHSNSFPTRQTKEGHQSFPQQRVKQDNRPSDLHHNLLEDVTIISDMSPKQFHRDHHVTNATTDLPMNKFNSEVTAESIYYSNDILDQSSFDKEMEEFDQLCEEIDVHFTNDEVTADILSCPICGLQFERGSTSQDLEEHTISCCPVDDIIIIDD